jgi:hypothetical protein
MRRPLTVYRGGNAIRYPLPVPRKPKTSIHASYDRHFRDEYFCISMHVNRLYFPAYIFIKEGIHGHVAAGKG